ncbi:MAG: DUF2892 domain-containing protein [Nitrospira sp.]|jgi:hypothetical protein
MLRNVRIVERWIRVIGGLLLMVLGITLPIPFWVEEVAETIGLLTVVSGAVGYCPVKHLHTRRAHKPVSASRGGDTADRG